MKDYILRRLLLMIPTLIGISLICFLLIQFVPGGPVEETIRKMQAAGAERGMEASRTISAEEIENIKAYFGFDKPIWLRYLIWLGNLVTLDMGTSYVYQEPVWDVIIKRMPISLFFGLTSFLISYLVCIPLGMKKAMRNHSTFDTSSSILIFVGYVIPGYALGVLLIIFFAGGRFLDWFPLGGIVSDNFEYLSLWGKVVDAVDVLRPVEGGSAARQVTAS